MFYLSKNGDNEYISSDTSDRSNTFHTLNSISTITEAATRGCSIIKGVLPEACNFIKRETLAQVFSCEFCEISKTTFFTQHLRTTASVY